MAGAEINLADVEWLAQRLQADLSLTLPTEFPKRDDGVEIVELVEETLLRRSPHDAIRANTPSALAQHFKDLADELRARNLMPHDDATNVVAALFAWYGCVSMAKTLREVDSRDEPYTDQLRRMDTQSSRGVGENLEGLGFATALRWPGSSKAIASSVVKTSAI